MKPLRTLPSPYHCYYESIVDSKNDNLKGGVPNINKQRLVALKTAIDGNYRHYSEKFENDDLSNINDSPYTANDKDYLISTYLTRSKSLSALKASIKASQDNHLQGTCQYCGINTPKTFDHFLPKDEYPEYAVLALNLLPCCGECNQKKGAYWKEAGQRKIINFYRDNLPHERFLFAHASQINNVTTLRFYIDNRNNINVHLYSIIESHFERLGLLSRYTDESNDEISNIVDAIASYGLNPDAIHIKAGINSNADRLGTRLGVNHWGVALHNALAECDDFISQLSALVQQKIQSAA